MLPIVDLSVVIITLCLFLFIGYHFRSTKNSTTVDYFLAGRTMSFIPAGFSITVSFISPVSLTLMIGEIYRHGYPFYVMGLACFVAGPIIIFFVVPKFYQYPILSVYEFLDMRFGRLVRTVNALIFLLAGVINTSVMAFGAAISIETLVGVPFWVSALAVGVFSTTYSTQGGIRAVIWTDFVQVFLMIAFFLFILIKSLTAFASLDDAWKLVEAGQRSSPNFIEGPTYRYTIQSTLVYYIIFYLFLVSVSQPGVQRWKSVSTLKQAQGTVFVSFILFGVFTVLVYCTGLALYAFYARCSMPRENIHPEKLSLHFASQELSSWPGVIGLCLAGIISSALSSISSYINSFSVVTLEDFVKFKYPSLSPSKELFLSKALTGLYGMLLTAMTFVVGRTESTTVVHLTAYSLSIAPPLATFFLGLWCKRANSVGVTFGLALSVLLLVWMSVSSHLGGNTAEPLPAENPLCDLNATWSNIDGLLQNVTDIESSSQHRRAWTGLSDFLYTVSVNWYPTIGLTLSATCGYLFSILYDLLSRNLQRFVSRESKQGNPPDVLHPLFQKIQESHV